MGNLARVNDVHSNLESGFTQLTTYFDKKYKVGWYYMGAQPRPCFTGTLLDEIKSFQQSVKIEMKNSKQEKYDYLVLASEVDNVFNLGGDLAIFSTLIQQKNRMGLLAYAVKCIDVLYNNIRHLDSELTTISLVKGDALGGGFEAALSSNVLIAERGTKLGLPEVLFNLFPGMGAYSLLSRKVSKAQAEALILSGQLYHAEELYEMGIVDILANKNGGETAVYKYIQSANRKANSHNAIRRVRDVCDQISYEELIEIAHIWVDFALKLSHKDLRMIERLVTRQTENATHSA